MRQLDLFSGIGGFALASGWAGFETVQFVEINQYCQKVLAKNFPGVPIHDDIKSFRGDGLGRIDLLTAGVPCQPASTAGKRQGDADPRWLWPEFLRLVQTVRPVWVLAENPVGLCSLKPKGLDWVLGELEALSYEPVSFVISAADVGAPHLRKRVWIVAKDSICAGLDREAILGSLGNIWNSGAGDAERLYPEQTPNSDLYQSQARRQHGTQPVSACPQIASNANLQHGIGGSKPQQPISAERGTWTEPGGNNRKAADTNLPRLERYREHDKLAERLCGARNWQESWHEVAARFCRVDDGIPRGLDRHRTARLEALGNSIVPQCAYPILKAIASIAKGEF